jgi:catechol 2,3-dioxygenase-like lactoylglutathione lyase family enzyme
MADSTFLGLRTVIYYVPDVAKARDWYTEALGIKPYFDEPFYVGFNVGGFELGLHPNEGMPSGSGGSVAYWGVNDMAGSWQRLLALGAASVSEAQDVGGGILVATVADPFGNHVGLILNPHFPNTA